MTPSARCQAAIELLKNIDTSSQAADAVLQSYFRKRRYAGGGDRRAIRSLVYSVLRKREQLDWWCRRSGAKTNSRQRILAAICFRIAWENVSLNAVFAGGRYGAKVLNNDEIIRSKAWLRDSLENSEQPENIQLNYPIWLNGAFSAALLPNLADELRALNREATVDLRVNSLKSNRNAVIEMLSAQGIKASPMEFAPNGIRLQKRHPFRQLEIFKEGLFEPQDESSQIAIELVDVSPGDKILDFCAGGGGKALALAAAMKNAGKIVLHDVDERRLQKAERRLERAGVTINERFENSSAAKDEFDIVIIDAPCSGSGVWRRNPETKWQITPAFLKQQIKIQATILEDAARFVRPGGKLAYMTCSVLEAENAAQIEKFIMDSSIPFDLVPVSEKVKKLTGLRAQNGCNTLLLTPWNHKTDGFFIALLERREG
jgi:16S rRNA (cytosine967-C5)-methyltransferase